MAATTAAPAPLELLTIGHSRHPLDRFLDLLRMHRVELLVDARSQPVSRFSPQFSRRALEASIAGASGGGAPMRYLFLGDALGGRPKDRACYGEDGAVDHDRIEQQAFYQRGIARLVEEAARARACVMCAEEDPARCHRRLLVARTLVRRGARIRHIRGSGALELEEALAADLAPAQLPLLPR
jgi:uncharacterized protein (DUF488 family)